MPLKAKAIKQRLLHHPPLAPSLQRAPRGRRRPDPLERSCSRRCEVTSSLTSPGMRQRHSGGDGGDCGHGYCCFGLRYRFWFCCLSQPLIAFYPWMRTDGHAPWGPRPHRPKAAPPVPKRPPRERVVRAITEGEVGVAIVRGGFEVRGQRRHLHAARRGRATDALGRSNPVGRADAVGGMTSPPDIPRATRRPRRPSNGRRKSWASWTTSSRSRAARAETMQ